MVENSLVWFGWFLIYDDHFSDMKYKSTEIIQDWGDRDGGQKHVRRKEGGERRGGETGGIGIMCWGNRREMNWRRTGMGKLEEWGKLDKKTT